MHPKQYAQMAPNAGASQLSVSVEEAARRSGIGRTTMYELMGDGRLPFVKIGSRRLVLVDDLRALLAAHRQGGAAAASAEAA